jgi:5-methylcytosine-specific restriction endonuclease McrA
VVAPGRTRSRHERAMRTNPQAMATYRAYRKLQAERIEAGEKVWCALCRKRILYAEARGRGDLLSLSIDHVRGYSDADPATWDASNLRPAHQGCNRRRGAPGAITAVNDEPASEYSRW